MTIKVNVTDDEANSLIVSAIEGGSNYWYMIQESDMSKTKYPAEAPMNGGHLMINDEVAAEGEAIDPVKIDKQRIHEALQIMADKYPKHFADIMDDNADQGTGDVLLQCAVFGKLIYG